MKPRPSRDLPALTVMLAGLGGDELGLHGNGNWRETRSTGFIYPERATFLKPAEQAEFGVETVHALVAELNEAWASEGRRALAPGSFPTSRVILRFVLNEARLAMARGSFGKPR